MTTDSIAEQQSADIAVAREEFEFRSRQLFDVSTYSRVADMPPNRHAEQQVYALYEQARDAYLAMVGAR